MEAICYGFEIPFFSLNDHLKMRGRRGDPLEMLERIVLRSALRAPLDRPLLHPR